MDEVEVEVVILSLGRTEDTLNAIASAAGQDGVSLRIIVVDQGSSEAHVAALARAAEKEPRLRLHAAGRNLGVPGGRNLGAELGSAPFICFLDNDAVFEDRNLLARGLARLRAQSDLGAIALRIILADSGEDQNQHWLHPSVTWHGAVEEVVEVARFIGAGNLLRRCAFAEIGGFDARFYFMEEERDLAYRLLNAGWRIRCFSDLKVLHRASPANRTGWRDMRFYYLVRNDLYGRCKRGTSVAELATRTAGHLLRGLRIGLGRLTLKAIVDGLREYLRYRRETPALLRQVHRLSPETRRRIASLEGRQGRTLSRLARTLSPLPGGRN